MISSVLCLFPAHILIQSLYLCDSITYTHSISHMFVRTYSNSCCLPPTLPFQVSFDTEVDAFLDLVAHCIKVLVAGILDRLDPAFRTMQAINWAGFTSVGEESQYLHTCNAVLLETIPKIRGALSSSYFSNLCNKIASEILQR